MEAVLLPMIPAQWEAEAGGPKVQAGQSNLAEPYVKKLLKGLVM